MISQSPKPSRSGRRFKVGDRVRFRRAVSEMTGTIIEDRGNLGGGGERVYRIEFWIDPEYPENRSLIELPVSEITAAN